MTQIFGYIVLAAGLAVFHFFARKDSYKAERQPLYLPPGEQNPVMRGKDGYYSKTRGAIVDYGLSVIGILAAIFTPWPGSPFLVGGMFAAWGGYLKIAMKKDLERFNRNMAEQRAILEKLRADPAGNHVPLPKLQGFGPNKLVFVSGSFYDFHEPTDIPIGLGVEILDYRERQEAARSVIKPRLVKLAQMNESEWFKVGRNLKV